MLLIHYLKHYYILIKHFTSTFHIVVVINLKKKKKKNTEVIILGKQVFICAVFSSPHSPKEHMAFVHGVCEHANTQTRTHNVVSPAVNAILIEIN